jgi:hypothetical protein
MPIDLRDIREWISLAFIIIGGSIALRTFIINQRQRKLENSFRMIDLINRSISKEDINNWHKVFIASSELAGANYGHFLDEKRNQRPFSDMFSEGNYFDQGAIERFCELFNLVGYEYLKGTIDLRIIYFEFGQYLSTIYDWVSSINVDDKHKDFMKSNYSYYHRMYQNNLKAFRSLPHKTISHIE